MKRVEVIFSQALEDEILTALAPIPEAARYSIIPNVRGRGYTIPKMGDAIWPGINEILIIYCSDAGAKAIEKAVGLVRDESPNEGVAFFAT
jgi:hypothetical protein